MTGLVTLGQLRVPYHWDRQQPPGHTQKHACKDIQSRTRTESVGDVMLVEEPFCTSLAYRVIYYSTEIKSMTKVLNTEAIRLLSKLIYLGFM